jgi:protein SCO1/2
MWIKLALGLLSCGQAPEIPALPYYDTPEFSPRWLEDAAAVEGLHRVPEFSLVDQRGRAVGREVMEGRIAVVNFFFVSCSGICPGMTRNLMAVQEAFAEDERVVMLSHSVQPEADTPEQLAKYGSDRGVDPERWRLLTGAPEEILRLGREVYFLDQQGEGDDLAFLHTESALLVDQRGHLRGMYSALKPADVQRLIEDIRELAESPGGA